MPTKKFLELDSNFRNRNTFPNPGQFEVNISQYGMRGQNNALDPITYAYPQITFSPNDIPCADTTSVYNGSYFSFNEGTGHSSELSNIISASSNTVLILTFNWTGRDPPISLSNNNYFPTYNGYCNGLILQTGNNQQLPCQNRRIIDWQYMQTDNKNQNQYFKVTIESPFDYDGNSQNPSSFSCTCIIYNTTDFSTDPSNSYIFLPSTLSVPNYYNKYMVYNITKNNYTPIINFDRDTHLAKINLSSFTGTQKWELTDRFVVRQSVPRYFDTTDLNNMLTFSGNIVTIDNQFNTFVWDNSYINNFIAIYPVLPFPPVLEHEATPSRQQLTLDPLILLITGFVKNIHGDFTDSAYFKTSDVIPSPIPDGTYYEILQFSVDNVSPFVYSGTMSSQSQAVAQEVSLNSLTLPNVTLQSGGRIAYYPYIYVELTNVSSPSGGTKNLIYSNNPNTYKAVFKVPITDLNHPTQSPFVKLTGNGMVQTMIFKQNDDMFISIRLPNGDIFQPSSTDFYPGNVSNPCLQISALFAIEKIN